MLLKRMRARTLAGPRPGKYNKAPKALKGKLPLSASVQVFAPWTGGIAPHALRGTQLDTVAENCLCYEPQPGGPGRNPS
jgi:hypothetical protein